MPDVVAAEPFGFTIGQFQIGRARRPVVGDAPSRFTACERSLKPAWPRPNAGANG